MGWVLDFFRIKKISRLCLTDARRLVAQRKVESSGCLLQSISSIIGVVCTLHSENIPTDLKG